MDLDSCKRPRDLQAYLLVLANHCPPVALLWCGERVQQADAPSLLQDGAPVPRACPATVFYDVVQSERHRAARQELLNTPGIFWASNKNIE